MSTPRASSSSSDSASRTGETADIPLGFGGVSAAPGDHIAHFYRGNAQRFSVLGPYIETGLRRGERCVFISAPDVAEELRSWLEARGRDVQAAEESGQLVLDPGRATPEDMRALAAQVEASVRENGPKAVRWSGDAGWALAADVSVHDMLHWEALYDKCSNENWQMLALCQFDQSQFSGDVLMDALRSHPYCVMGQVVVPNPFHMSPEALMEELAAKENGASS
jgi:hypothetical protein